jgi:hypothetical protein
VIPYFKEYAAAFIAQSDASAEDLLARCMAAMTGRKLTVTR